MEREHWFEISKAVSEVDSSWKDSKRYKHPTALIVRVYLWAAAHNCAVCWACVEKNWDKATLPLELPGQPTMSRRARTKAFDLFMAAVGKRLDGKKSACLLHLRRADGKPLPVAAHSKDRDAKFGRGAGQKARGYKLHVIWSKSPMPDQWCVTPLNTPEKQMINRMVKRLDGCGYLLADGHYDHSDLHDTTAANNHQLVAPRQHPGANLGHHYQSPHRKRCIQMLEIPANIDTFGRRLFGHRKQIERDFGNLTGHGGGLICLPPWIRRPWRVRHWTHAKLLLNAARIRCLRRRKAIAA